MQKTKSVWLRGVLAIVAGLLVIGPTVLAGTVPDPPAVYNRTPIFLSVSVNPDPHIGVPSTITAIVSFSDGNFYDVSESTGTVFSPVNIIGSGVIVGPQSNIYLATVAGFAAVQGRYSNAVGTVAGSWLFTNLP